MPKFAANLTMMFNEVPFAERFEAAAMAGFEAVECLFPYALDTEEFAGLLRRFNSCAGDIQPAAGKLGSRRSRNRLSSRTL